MRTASSRKPLSSVWSWIIACSLLLCGVVPSCPAAEGAAPVEALPTTRESLDERLFHAINLKPGHRDALDPLLQGLMPLGDRAAIAVPLGLYGWGRLAGDRRLREVGVFAAAAMASSALVTEGLKGLIARERPVQHLGEAKVRVVGPRAADNRSFPSGHTSNAFAWATVLAGLYPDQELLCYGVATAIAFGRVRLGAHYPSDVLAGAAIGYLAGRLVLDHRDLLLRREEPAPGLNTLGVAQRFRF
ncbi:MAG: phosphatase PAP2 family protein [Armatimonadetes bacterium]|nr:phosphatase PAP2 family protein [Armatimonadota bacterium]